MTRAFRAETACRAVFVQQCAVDLDACVVCVSRSHSFAPSATDATVVAALAGKTIDASKFPNVARYVNHINHFSADARSKYVPLPGAVACTRAEWRCSHATASRSFRAALPRAGLLAVRATARLLRTRSTRMFHDVALPAFPVGVSVGVAVQVGHRLRCRVDWRCPRGWWWCSRQGRRWQGRRLGFGRHVC
jgi:hypothetical protein